MKHARVALFLAVVLLVAILSGCGSGNRWLGFVYPDKTNLIEYRIVGEFRDLNDCLSAVNKAAGPNGAYECGLNCKPSEVPGSDLYACERTVGNEKRASR